MAAALGAFEKIPHSVATACGKFGGFEPSNKSTVARQATYVFCEWNPADTFSGCLAAASNQLGEQSFVIPNIEQRRIRVLEKQLRDAWHARAVRQRRLTRRHCRGGRVPIARVQNTSTFHCAAGDCAGACAGLRRGRGTAAGGGTEEMFSLRSRSTACSVARS